MAPAPGDTEPRLWGRLWAAAPAVPAVRQRPIVDPVREGEGVLHYLETLTVRELLPQLAVASLSVAGQVLEAVQTSLIRTLGTNSGEDSAVGSTGSGGAGVGAVSLAASAARFADVVQEFFRRVDRVVVDAVVHPRRTALVAAAGVAAATAVGLPMASSSLSSSSASSPLGKVATVASAAVSTLADVVELQGGVADEEAAEDDREMAHLAFRAVCALADWETNVARAVALRDLLSLSVPTATLGSVPLAPSAAAAFVDAAVEPAAEYTPSAGGLAGSGALTLPPAWWTDPSEVPESGGGGIPTRVSQCPPRDALLAAVGEASRTRQARGGGPASPGFHDEVRVPDGLDDPYRHWSAYHSVRVRLESSAPLRRCTTVRLAPAMQPVLAVAVARAFRVPPRGPMPLPTLQEFTFEDAAPEIEGADRGSQLRLFVRASRDRVRLAASFLES